LIIDDDPIQRALLRMVISRIEGAELCGESEDANAGLELTLRLQPDVVVVDWLMPGLSGLEFLHLLRAAGGAQKAVFCTGHPTGTLPLDLLRLGVQGYLDKRVSLATLEAALRTVIEGGMFFASKTPADYTFNKGGEVVRRKALSERLAIVPANRLSAREREVAASVAGGLSSKQVAAQLGIGVRTVEAHRANLMRKLAITDVPTLTRWCMRVGL